MKLLRIFWNSVPVAFYANKWNDMHLKRVDQTVNKVMCHWINRTCGVLPHWYSLNGFEVLCCFYFVYTIYIYLRYGCKLNSLFLEDLFIQMVYIGRWLRRSYLRSHRFTSYSYFITSIYYCRIYTQHSTVCKNVWILWLLSMELGSWTEDDRNFVLATWRVGWDWLAGTLNGAVFGLCTLQSK